MEQVTPLWTNPPKHIKTYCDCVGLSLGLSPPGSLTDLYEFCETMEA